MAVRGHGAAGRGSGVLTIPMVPYMEALAIERDALVQLMAMVFCTSVLALALILAETLHLSAQGRAEVPMPALSAWLTDPYARHPCRPKKRVVDSGAWNPGTDKANSTISRG